MDLVADRLMLLHLGTVGIIELATLDEADEQESGTQGEADAVQDCVDEESDEVTVVLPTDTIVDHLTVVVVTLNASLADGTVADVGTPDGPASEAEVVDVPSVLDGLRDQFGKLLSVYLLGVARLVTGG